MKTLLLTLLLVPMMSFGQNNYSMSFDGVDDYVGLTPIDLSNSNEITLMSWFNIQDLQGNESSTIIRQEAGEPNFLLQFENFGNNIEFNIEDDTGTNFSFSISISPSSLEGDWHNISATYDGNYQKIYIDGLLVGDNLISGGNIAYGNGGNPIFLSLGAMYSSSGNINEVTNGSLDDIQVWGTSLTQSEIQQYMNCPPTGTESGLVGYWNFEEGSGTTAYDLTSNGNDGTINGATYSTDVPFQNCCVATSSTDVITACDHYTWIDGNTYTASTNNPNPTLHTINAGSYYYLPSTLTINTGDVVEWINDGGFHDVNGETNTITGLPYNNPEVFNSPSTSVVGAVIYSHTFTVPGTYEYDCSVGQHAANGMVGTITVLPPLQHLQL